MPVLSRFCTMAADIFVARLSESRTLRKAWIQESVLASRQPATTGYDSVSDKYIPGRDYDPAR